MLAGKDTNGFLEGLPVHGGMLRWVGDTVSPFTSVQIGISILRNVSGCGPIFIPVRH